MFHLQVKRKDGTLVMAYMTSKKETPKLKQRVECPLRNGQPVRGRVSAIITNTILSDEGQPIDLVEAIEV